MFFSSVSFRVTSRSLSLFFLFCVFDTGSCSVVQVGPELTVIFWSQPPACWDHRPVLPHWLGGISFSGYTWPLALHVLERLL